MGPERLLSMYGQTTNVTLGADMLSVGGVWIIGLLVGICFPSTRVAGICASFNINTFFPGEGIPIIGYDSLDNLYGGCVSVLLVQL